MDHQEEVLFIKWVKEKRIELLKRLRKNKQKRKVTRDLNQEDKSNA